MLNVNKLGQVFTPSHIIDIMLSLKKNNGSVLEPSVGNGAFFNVIANCTGIEVDDSISPRHENIINMDFFDYSIKNQFDTIIGNPPYVKYKNIQLDTKHKLNLEMFDERTNLYMFFIEKCIHHLAPGGELIFITPRDFIKASGSVKLNKLLYARGTITHWHDLGDEEVFPGVSPNCAIFRFEKDNFSRQTLSPIFPASKTKILNFLEMNGQLTFAQNNYPVKFSDLFMVKVGAVSGLDEYFTHENGSVEFVYSKTHATGETRRMIYNQAHEDLLPFKEKLLSRKIRLFNEKTWFMWGRNYHESDSKRIYVNAKTRKNHPFFLHPSFAYDGSILALFPKFELSDSQLIQLKDDLNKVTWDDLGFVCDGRYLFTQRSLEQCYLPANFEQYLVL